MDITMCKANDCPIKDKCKRYTAKAGLMQSYFLDTPFKIVDNVFTCEMFYNNNINLEDVLI